MSGEITVRAARPEDAGRLLEIYAPYVLQTAVTFEYDVPAPEEFRGRIERTLERYPYLVALRDGAVEGYAYAGPLKERRAYDWACEVTVYVDRAAHGHGLGRALYGALERELAAMGVRNLYACIAVPEREDEYLTLDSQRFHAHMGYRTVGEFRNSGCKFGRWYHMIWMEKLIGGHENDPPPVRFRGRNG